MYFEKYTTFFTSKIGPVKFKEMSSFSEERICKDDKHIVL